MSEHPREANDGEPAPAARRPAMSELLRSLAAAWPGERIALGDLETALGERSFGVLVLVFSIPALVPGVASLAAVPLALLGAQLCLGRETPWMPAFVRRRSMAKRDFARAVGRVAPLLARLERLVRPRPAVALGPAGERAVGAMCVLLAALLPVPLPFGNALVVAPLMLLGLALAARDGRMALGGLFAGAACAALFLAITWATLRGSAHVAAHYVGRGG
jgi:hypothetical protein